MVRHWSQLSFAVYLSKKIDSTYTDITVHLRWEKLPHSGIFAYQEILYSKLVARKGLFEAIYGIYSPYPDTVAFQSFKTGWDLEMKNDE